VYVRKSHYAVIQTQVFSRTFMFSPQG